MNADAELNAAVLWHAGIALDHSSLNLNSASHGVDDAAKLMSAPSPVLLTIAPVMHVDGRVDQIAAQRRQPRERTVLVRSNQPAVTDNVGDQDRSDLSGSRHRRPSGVRQISTNARRGRPLWVIDAIEPIGGRPRANGKRRHWLDLVHSPKRRPGRPLFAQSGRHCGAITGGFDPCAARRRPPARESHQR